MGSKLLSAAEVAKRMVVSQQLVSLREAQGRVKPTRLPVQKAGRKWRKFYRESDLEAFAIAPTPPARFTDAAGNWISGREAARAKALKLPYNTTAQWRKAKRCPRLPDEKLQIRFEHGQWYFLESQLARAIGVRVPPPRQTAVLISGGRWLPLREVAEQTGLGEEALRSFWNGEARCGAGRLMKLWNASVGRPLRKKTVDASARATKRRYGKVKTIHSDEVPLLASLFAVPPAQPIAVPSEKRGRGRPKGSKSRSPERARGDQRIADGFRTSGCRNYEEYAASVLRDGTTADEVKEAIDRHRKAFRK